MDLTSYLSKFSTQSETSRLELPKSENVSLCMDVHCIATTSYSKPLYSFAVSCMPTVSFRIQQCQVELQQMKERGDTLQGELVVKNMRLTDMQVKCKLLCVHRDILQEQRDKLSESKRQLVEELVSNIQCKELEIIVFCMLHVFHSNRAMKLKS